MTPDDDRDPITIYDDERYYSYAPPEEEKPRWTWQRVVALLIVLLIIFSLLAMDAFPILQSIFNPPELAPGVGQPL